MLWLEAEPFEGQSWAEAFNRGVSEKDPSKLTSRVDAAHLAMASRIAELS
jgi:hypothetical protein